MTRQNKNNREVILERSKRWDTFLTPRIFLLHFTDLFFNGLLTLIYFLYFIFAIRIFLSMCCCGRPTSSIPFPHPAYTFIPLPSHLSHAVVWKKMHRKSRNYTLEFSMLQKCIFYRTKRRSILLIPKYE